MNRKYPQCPIQENLPYRTKTLQNDDGLKHFFAFLAYCPKFTCPPWGFCIESARIKRERLVLATGTPAEQHDIAALSFEVALRELEGIVKRMETGEAELEQAIADYARGMALKSHCERKLAHARMKVEKIVQGEEGKAATAPFDPEAS